MPAEMTELGRQLFSDPQLSAFGKMSCATCHDARFAYGPPNARSTQMGGPGLQTAGLRAVVDAGNPGRRGRRIPLAERSDIRVPSNHTHVSLQQKGG